MLIIDFLNIRKIVRELHLIAFRVLCGLVGSGARFLTIAFELVGASCAQEFGILGDLLLISVLLFELLLVIGAFGIGEHQLLKQYLFLHAIDVDIFNGELTK